jgi:hypothetical protein
MTLRPAILALLCVLPARIFAQSPQPSADAVRVYLDCSWFCDTDFTRTEINYVNWVRDRADAQVHVLVSRLGTGGGGSVYTLTFTGLKHFAGREDTLRYTSRVTDSDDVLRRGLVQRLKLGLVPFIARTADAERMQVTLTAPPGAEKKPGAADKPVRDAWNYWVFSVNASSNFNGEASYKDTNLRGNFSANRTTDAFKIRLGMNMSYNESDFTYQVAPEDTTLAAYDTTVVSIRRSNSISLLAVKSFGTHWSAGMAAGANSATRGNIELGLNGGPALEYSFWPYAEATRRALLFRYQAGMRSYNYREITIYNKTAESHPTHQFTAELGLRQRFGSINIEGNFSQYLHHTSFYNANIFADADVKLFKGFSLNVFGQYEAVHDQITLAASDPTQTDVLLQQRQLATTYGYWGGFGLRYSFGSIFNNVVNPRFGQSF